MARCPDGPTPGSAADDQAEADPEQVARTVLLRRLTAAPRTRHDLREDLLRRNIPVEVADRVLDRFVEVGLVDDASYARMWVESRQRSRGTARPVLRQELRAKGVPAEHIDEVLEGVDPAQERARAAELVRRRLPSTARLDPVARMRRLSGMLVRRGYASSVAFSVVREVLETEADEGFDADLPDETT
jgi:regulatory protein